MAKFVVRRANLDDLPRLVELWTEQRDIEAQLDPRLGLVVDSPFDFEVELRKRLEHGKPDSSEQVLIAIHEFRIVGFIWAGWRYALVKDRMCQGFVRVLVVDAHDGQGGVGTVLLDAAIGWLRDARVEHLIIENVPRHVAVQHAFWRAKGAGVIRETLYLPISREGEMQTDDEV